MMVGERFAVKQILIALYTHELRPASFRQLLGVLEFYVASSIARIAESFATMRTDE